MCFFAIQTVFAYTDDRASYGQAHQDATSTNYQLKGAAGDPAVGRSYSANYIFDHGLSIDLEMMTLTVATSVNFGVILPQVPSLVTSTAVVNMVGALNGYNLQIKRDDATSTLNQNGTSTPDVIFPDATIWDPTGPGNATTTPGDNLSFRVEQAGTTSYYDTTWWGADDSLGVAKHAGFPPTSRIVMNCGNCNFGSTITVIRYRASAPLSQITGSYSGQLTITALVNP